MPGVAQPWVAVQGYPHVTWCGVVDAHDRLFLHFACRVCGDKTQKYCSNIHRGPYWATWYAQLHPATAHRQ